LLKKCLNSSLGISILAVKPWHLTLTSDNPHSLRYSSAFSTIFSLSLVISWPYGNLDDKQGWAGLSHQGKPNALDISLMSCFENLNFARGEITPACFDACITGL